MKRDTKTKGDISELLVMAAFLESGYAIAKPFGENVRYDFLAERAGRYLRIQVKTGRLRNGVVLFNRLSSHYHRHGGGSRGYKDDADRFGIYCRQTNTVYVVPVSGEGTASYLRVAPVKNGQRRGVRWASDYAFLQLPFPGLVGLPWGDGVAKGAMPS